MDIEEIRTFVTIARTPSFALAARDLNRTQPAISRRISGLEASYGVTLLERLPSGARLTPAGAALLPFAEAMLAAAGDGRRACQSAVKRAQASPRVAIIGTLVGRELVRALKRWSGRETAVRRIELVTANSTRVTEMVLSGDVDIGVRYHTEPSALLAVRPIADEEMIVVKAADAANEPDGGREPTWITFSSRRRTRDAVERQIMKQLRANAQSDPHILECDSLAAQKALVEAGVGMGVMPYRFVQADLASGILARVGHSGIAAKVPICLVTRHQGFMSNCMTSLMDSIADAFGSQSPGIAVRACETPLRVIQGQPEQAARG